MDLLGHLELMGIQVIEEYLAILDSRVTVVQRYGKCHVPPHIEQYTRASMHKI